MNIQIAILKALDRVCSETTHFPLPETTLLSDVNLQLPRPITLTPLRQELARLEAKQQVVSVEHEDKGTLWKITAAGRARLADN